MAQLLNQFGFSGTLGNISAYKRRDSDKIILRTKGGPSKEKIKKSPAFDITRRINSEFGGRASATKYLLSALWPLKPMADYNIAGPLNALIKPIQAMDTVSDYGKRNVCFTKNPSLLEGFNLNRRNSFDSIVRNPVSYTLSKEHLSAQVTSQAMIPGINFFVPRGQYPLYSLIIAGCIVPDLFYNENGYKTHAGYEYLKCGIAKTEWYPVAGGSPATVLETNFATPGMQMTDPSYSVMLSIGICFGTVGSGGEVQPVKYAGAARILAMK